MKVRKLLLKLKKKKKDILQSEQPSHCIQREADENLVSPELLNSILSERFRVYVQIYLLHNIAQDMRIKNQEPIILLKEEKQILYTGGFGALSEGISLRQICLLRLAKFVAKNRCFVFGNHFPIYRTYEEAYNSVYLKNKNYHRYPYYHPRDCPFRPLFVLIKNHPYACRCPYNCVLIPHGPIKSKF